MSKQINDKLTEKYSADIGKMDDSSFENQWYMPAGSNSGPLFINYRFRFFPRRVNGTVSRRRHIKDAAVVMSYCPFCGKKYEDSTTNKS